MPSITPSWSAATPGERTASGQVNQFLTAHSAQFTYIGTAANTHSVLGGGTDYFSTYNYMAYKLVLPTTTTISRMAGAFVFFGAGIDLKVTLQTANTLGNAPSGTVLASTYIPAEWITFDSNSGISMEQWGGCVLSPSSSLAAGTYFVVVSPAGSSNSTTTVGLNRDSTTPYNAYTSTDGVTWTAQSYSYGIFLWTSTTTNPLFQYSISAVSEDNGLMMKSYSYKTSGPMASVKEWVARSTSAPINLLARDDASLLNSASPTNVGSWSGINCTISAATPSTPIYGSRAYAMTVSGTLLSSVSMSTAHSATYPIYTPVTAGNTYTGVASSLPAASTMRKVQTSIAWYNSAGTLISTSDGTAVTQTSTSTPVQATVSAVAPTGATNASVKVSIQTVSGNLSSGEVHYVDCVGLFQGSNAVWSYPGLGVSSTRTVNTDSSTGLITSVV